MSRRVAEGVDLLRRKLKLIGVIVPALILADLLAAKTATAATPALAAGLGKMALAGVGAGHGTAAAAGGTAVVGKIVLVAGSLCGVLVLTVVVGLVYAAARGPRITVVNEAPPQPQAAQPPIELRSAENAGVPAEPLTPNLKDSRLFAGTGMEARVDIVSHRAGNSTANYRPYVSQLRDRRGPC